MWLTTVALAIFAELVEPTGREVCPRGDTASVPSIPKILHFIWWPGSERLPVHLKPNLGAWKSHHSDWELRVWGEAEVTSLIQMEVSWLFQRYKRISTIGKHDLARYAILFHLGGLVVEADTLALRAFDPVLAGRELVLFRAREDMRALGANLSLAMMAAKPQHPLIWRALNASLDDKFDAAGAHRMGIVLHNCSLFAEPAPKAEQSKEGGEARAKEVGAGEAEPRCSSGEGGADVPCAGEAEVAACGCYSILDSAPFLPYHSALSALPHASPQAHMAVLAEFEERLLAHEFPPPDSFSVQYSLLSWVASADSAIAFLLVGVSHALHGNREEAHRLLEPLVWYWWGDRYKYPPPGSGAKPDVRAAKKAYKEALRLAPNMAAAHHELANVHREKGRLLLAVEHYLKVTLAVCSGRARRAHTLGHRARAALTRAPTRTPTAFSPSLARGPPGARARPSQLHGGE